jgi:phage shock protein A
MQYFRRMASGVVAQVDQILSRIENHDALIDCALRDVRAATARAKVQLQRVRRDGEQLRTQLRAADQEQAQWKRRALRFRDHDEERALECLRRRRQAARRAEELRARLEQHDGTERSLAGEVAQLEQRVGELRERQHRMRTRQSCAEATAAVDEAGQGATEDIEDTFERWEIRLTEAEMTHGTGGERPDDPFARELDAEEAEQALRAELDELTDQENRQQGEGDHGDR